MSKAKPTAPKPQPTAPTPAPVAPVLPEQAPTPNEQATEPAEPVALEVVDVPTAPTPEPTPTLAPTPKLDAIEAEIGGDVKVKNLTNYDYTIDDIKLPPNAEIELNLGLLDASTRAKIEHGVKVGSFGFTKV